MTAHIIPLAPCPRDENVFFLADEEKLDTEWGKKWLESFKKHWTAFVSNRQKELKKHGQLFVTVLIVDNPSLDY